ncbi:MAG: type IV pilus biogenesis/stability protein PilW [Proteobacteria bacterium]|nr:type IV pilus biogenesis/stability protein PilW [Pseudomonadota bacterium]
MKPLYALTCAGLASLMMAGCATTDSTTAPTIETSTIVGDSSDPRNRARLRTELASLYFSRGSMGVALEELRSAVAADPGFAGAYSMLGLVYMELRENRLAEENFQRALGLASTDPDINHNYGWFLCQTAREDQSIEFFLKAIRNPLYARPGRSYAAAGSCLLRKDRLKESGEMLERALKLEPDEPLALLHMGQLRFRSGALEEARKHVLRFNRLTGGTPESLWLGLRTERRLGERVAEASYANQLRRRFPASREYQQLQRGAYD